jgi:hypothetical protein
MSTPSSFSPAKPPTPGTTTRARDTLKKALAVNPSSLDAHALVAALAFVQDKPQEFEAEADKTLAIAPRYGDVYRTAGELAAHNYRFDEAVTLTRRALSLDPENPRTLADLGTHLLRTGDEPAARTALEASFKIDPYNKITFNLLGMMDVLDKFVTVRDGDVVMRLDKGEAPVLQEYAMSLTHQALKTLAARYEFTPKGPILVEIFPKHDDFAVRNVGLPGPHRRARHLLRPRRDDGLAARASAGRIPMGGDALARAGARHHAPDVEPAHPAVAHRGHFGLRRETGARRVGARNGRGVRRHAEPWRNGQAPRAQRGVPEPQDDLARVLPGVATGRTSGHGLR